MFEPPEAGVQQGGQAQSAQTALIDRIEIDIFRTEEELKSRSQASMAEDSDGSDVLIHDAPPDPEDACM